MVLPDENAVIEVEGEPAAPEAVEEELSERDALAKRHREKRNAEIAAEAPEAPVPDPDPEGEGEDQPTADPPVDAEADDAGEAGGGDDPAPADAPAVEPERKFIVKINGTDREMSESEVLAAASRVHGADEKFQQANGVLAEARRVAALPPAAVAPAAPEPQPSGTAPAAGVTPEPLSTSTPPDEELTALGESLQYGDEEARTAALGRVIELAKGEGQPASSDAQVINAQEIVEQVTDQVTYDTALKTVSGEYSDVFKDKTSVKLATDFLGNYQRNELFSKAGVPAADINAMDRKTLTETYVKHARLGMVAPVETAMAGACMAVRQYRGVENTEPQPNPGESVITADGGKRVTRKRSAASPPATKSGRPAAQAGPAPRLKRSSVIAGMRDRREAGRA